LDQPKHPLHWWVLQREGARSADTFAAGGVRQITYWGIVGNRIIGCSRLRLQLTPALEQIGGHIGYDIRPQHRCQGYGTCLLELSLERARTFGLHGVLITCDVDNIGSSRIIEKNGGQLLNRGMVTGYAKLIARYWIDLSSENQGNHQVVRSEQTLGTPRL
jgi:predicted acetyltransferase